MTTLQLFQEKIGTEPDNSFGPVTLKTAMDYYGMSSEMAAHFFGQAAYETGGFHLFIENLNYSAQELNDKFKKYFPGNLADLYARQPIKIASRIYGNRMGNGDEKSREGYIFLGRGALQLTGKDNYTLFAKAIGDPEIMINPDLVATDYAFESAIFFFNKNNLWSMCSNGVNDEIITELTVKINGGITGLLERDSITKTYYSWLT